MEASTLWFLAIVPILGAVAVADSCTRSSARISQRWKIADAVWIHLGILLVSLVGYVAWLFVTFPDLGAIVDAKAEYRSERTRGDARQYRDSHLDREHACHKGDCAR